MRVLVGDPSDHRSCMTLFRAADPECRTFQAVLDKFFVGGIAKGHPTADEIRKAVEFYQNLQ